MTFGNLVPMQNKLTITKPALFILLIVVFFKLASCSSQKSEQNKPASQKPNYSVLITQQQNADTTWGYIILQNDKQIIRQFTIPAIAGNIPFFNQFEANLVGNLVVKKLNHSQPPSVSKKELDSLGITLPKHDRKNQQTTYW